MRVIATFGRHFEEQGELSQTEKRLAGVVIVDESVALSYLLLNKVGCLSHSSAWAVRKKRYPSVSNS